MNLFKSIIDVAKITDGARSLGLTQGKIEYGRDIVKIGKSEVEIITENGIRHYTNLADNSNIVLTFSTSLGELEVIAFLIIVRTGHRKAESTARRKDSNRGMFFLALFFIANQ